MADVKITDLVDQEAINKIKELDSELKTVLNTYTQVAKDLAHGLNVEVKVVGDIDKMEKWLTDKGKEAAEAQQRLTNVMQEQSRVIANTTNTVARQLMERERVNKATRDSYTEQERVKKLLDQYHDTYENQIESFIRINKQLDENKQKMKDNEKAVKNGRMSASDFAKAQAELLASTRDLTQQKRTLNQIMTAEEKANQSAEGSYNRLSQQLELLKKAYKDLGKEGRSSDFGKEMEQAMQNLDAHLKDMAADMGEFQRNVGNYAIAGQNGVVATESVIAAMNREAVTTQDLIDQTRILEEAKQMLNTSDANYQSTLDSLNAKIDDNKRKLSDVSDILKKDATSVAEAEEQNKRLQAALKHVDLSSDDAQERIRELNEKIAANTRIIKENTPSIQEQAKAIEKQTKANEGLAGSLLSLVGINANFGSSLKSLEGAGTANVFDGLNTKVKAFGSTLIGLLANPWVLAFLGIAGVVAGFKWWYDYNKGLEEASRLTENFTGATGEAADKVTSDMSALADHMGKGYDETIGAANTLVQQFGVSWEQANQLIKDGIQAGADMSGNMLSNIDQFAPALRDAGVSADEFMAIISETRNGIFSEDGVQDIVKAGTRLRAMNAQMAASLDAVGISSAKMKKDLEEGTISMMDAVQQVAAKLQELPENSQEAGLVMKNVFGRSAAEGGELLIQSIAGVNTNLEKAKELTGEWGEATRKQLEAEQELAETVNAVFKMSGTSFESMIANAKAFIAKGLTVIIKKCVDIVNWFINLYNEAKYVRVAVAKIVFVFKTLWTVAKSLFELLMNGFQGLGGVIEGIMLVFSGELEAGMNKIKSSFSQGFANIKNIVIKAGKDIGQNFVDSYSGVLDRKLKNVSVDLSPDGKTTKDTTNTKDKLPPVKPTGDGGGKGSGKASREAEKAARETLKKLQDLEESKIAVMKDGHEKDMAMIRLNFKKKLDTIKCNSEEEEKTRINIIAQMETALSQCESKYQQNLASINLANRLTITKKGSKEELDLKLAQIEASRKKELQEAEKTGASVLLINQKFNQQKTALQEEYADQQLQALQKQYADQQEIDDTAMLVELNKLKQNFAKQLTAAKGNAEAQERLKEQFERESADIQERYAIQTAQKAVKLIEEQLKTENLSAEERANLERQLAKAKADLEQQMADAAKRSADEAVEADNKATEKRIANVQQWLQVAADSLNTINDLISTVYDAKMTKVEEEQEANTEAGDAEQERIQRLVEQKVITEEEGEARKRAAEAKTAQKNEELEKKKAKLKERQAKFDKLNSIAQCGIATALAIMNALQMKPFPVGIAMAAIAGAMGAVQLATIIATPLPKYAKGTDFHKGGPAIVGDGGVPEVITFGGNAWLTPDTPTLADLPKGASVIPNVSKFSESELVVAKPLMQGGKTAPKAYNDAKVLDRLDSLIYMKQREARSRRQSEVDSQLARYILSKNL